MTNVAQTPNDAFELFTLPVLSNPSAFKASAPLHGLAHANTVSVLDYMYRHLVGTVSQFLFCIMRTDLYLSRIPVVLYLHFISNMLTEAVLMNAEQTQAISH